MRTLWQGLAAWTLAACAAAAQAETEVNTANQAELEQVQGIGPQLSERILAVRHQARFSSWDDFMSRLKGVGPARAAKLSAAGLMVAGEAYPPAGTAAASAALKP